jgi:exodeoxyribonuclease VII large subunit
VRLFEEPAPVLQLTVSQFSDRFSAWIAKRPELRRIAIIGEISGWSPQASGNIFFSLKDHRAILRCFARVREARKFPPISNGLSVVATGAIGIWEPSSEYQLRVVEVALLGAGAIAAKVEALRKRLQAEGLFDQRRKRVFARFPRRVALVSARGKGAADFESTLREKSPNVTVLFVETRVQGDGAEIDIAEAIDRASRAKVDAIIVLRGGGSYEDRYPFNTEPVVRAIARSRHPVVTAIGHTGDRHLADEVADAVFKTPTAAAEHIAGSWAEVTGRLARQHDQLAAAIERVTARQEQRRDRADQELDRAIERRLSESRRRLLQLQNGIERQNPRYRLGLRQNRFTAVLLKIDGARDRLFSQRVNALALARSRLLAANPEGPLERGYAIVTHAGRALRDAQDVAIGDEIDARLFHGRLTASVERVVIDE